MTSPVLTTRIDQLPDGEIHAVGAAGLETASMVRFLVEGGRGDVVLHDLADDLDGAFQAAHRFQPAEHSERARAALARCRDLRTGPDYLRGIESAVAVLVPSSWFLHPANARVESLRDRFVTFPDVCFDLWQGPIIGITGSYGKTTTSRFTAALVDGVFCGNDREALCDLGALTEGPPDRTMVFEVSNRHLRNGFRRTLDVGVLTGITLNHEPDHGSFEAYRKAKYSLADRSQRFLYHASIPGAFADASVLKRRGRSYGEAGAWRLSDAGVHGPGGVWCPVPGAAGFSVLHQDDVVAATAAALYCGVPAEEIAQRSSALAGAVPRYRQSVRTQAGRLVINDSASCMPASTAALIKTLQGRFVLICGGDRQRYRSGEFDVLAAAVKTNPGTALVCTTGPLAGEIEASLRRVGFDAVIRCDDVEHAVTRAVAEAGAALVFSPGCGTGSLFLDKYRRGEVFDNAVATAVSGGQALP